MTGLYLESGLCLDPSDVKIITTYSKDIKKGFFSKYVKHYYIRIIFNKNIEPFFFDYGTNKELRNKDFEIISKQFLNYLSVVKGMVDVSKI